ncbi:phosphomannomutase/phosphoglucomutase [Brackiella oedipodis]|uniref:phosphomannomutase/phosphoglucomutase n=1 Tax=Brackiella oedipodis TaxID=124225 RepID=UPI0006872F9A|nr:phosphomannomutase/phosphoglucomutase [Brackiella oedipodis]
MTQSTSHQATGLALPSNVFKAYDIRGIVPDQLNPPFAYLLGRALAVQARQHGIEQAVVGYDGRHSSPELSSHLIQGMNAEGLNVVLLGQVPTPLVYFMAYSKNIGVAVAITGSHNPPQYNGFKMMMQGKAIYGEQVTALRELMQSLQGQETSAQSVGQCQQVTIIDDYVQRIVSDVKLARPMHIAIDCGNGVGAAVAPQLFKALGCQVDELYCDVDGDFPNHHPDPADPHNLEDLIHHVRTTDCELGLAFDGDADRLGVVTKSGQIIWPDRQLILFAQDILQRHAGATVIYDVKCSRHVALEVEKAGGQPLMWKTGHSLVKSKLAETGAPLAGEMSGHTFFKERWYGFDDGLYSGTRLLEILSKHGNPSEVLEAIPQDLSTPELKLQLQEGQAHPLIARLQAEGQFPSAKSLVKIDGVRAEYEDGFGLARASNTTPVIVLRFEAQSKEALQRIQAEFKAAIEQLLPDAKLPF